LRCTGASFTHTEGFGSLGRITEDDSGCLLFLKGLVGVLAEKGAKKSGHNGFPCSNKRDTKATDCEEVTFQGKQFCVGLSKSSNGKAFYLDDCQLLALKT